MEKSKEIIETLNDLIQINNDRIAGYEQALKELSDSDDDLKPLFDAMIAESRQIKSELVHEVQVLRGDTANGTTAKGKIYRAWLNVRAIFTGPDRQSVLSNCESGEDAAQNAYTQALESNALPVFIRQMLLTQQEILRTAHDEIRDLRNHYA